MRGLSREPGFHLLEKSQLPIRSAFLTQRLQRMSKHGYRPLSVIGRFGRKGLRIRDRQGEKSILVQRNRHHPAATLQSLSSLALMRKEMLYRSEQVGTKAAEITLRRTDRTATEHVGKEVVRQIARRIPVAQLALQEGVYRLVIRITQIRQRHAAILRIRLRTPHLRPPRGVKRDGAGGRGHAGSCKNDTPCATTRHRPTHHFRNGDAGMPASLKSVAVGLSFHA